MEPRYIVKWTNGFWKLFDTKAFKDVDKFVLKSKAVRALPAP